MEQRAQIQDVLLNAMAKAFKIDKADMENNLQLSFIGDLKATSVQFFPVISALEDEFDIELQYADFRRNCKTIADAIDFVESTYKRVYGDN